MIKINYNESGYVVFPFDPTEPYVSLTNEEYESVKDDDVALKNLIESKKVI
jgi:hypothetical protein